MRSTFLLAIGLLAASATPAQALLCTPIVGCTCSVSANDIAFTGVNPLSGAASAQGDVAVDCTGVIDVAPSVTVQINKGVWGTISARKMRDGAGHLLDYNIYTAVNHAIVWGDGTSGSSTLSVSGGLLTLGHWTASRTMYGIVSPATSTVPGGYSDTIVVRIDW
jgi:spore coat protein U-like protein